MTESMDVLPRMVAHMIQLGLSARLEKVKMYWVCASCQNCGVVCPRGIDLPRVMEALRLLTLRKNRNFIEPSHLAVETIHEFPQIALVAAFRKSTS
jgi:heterodisulfide reductase subunit C